jgi:hypothetical protein
MKKNLFSQYGAFNPRVLLAFALCSAGVLLALFSLAAPSTPSTSAFGGTDINLITGAETFPRVTQAEGTSWGHGQTVVVAYADSSGSGLSPVSICGVSVSTNGGATFTRLPNKFTENGPCYGGASVIYSVRAAKWTVRFVSGACGSLGIGQWFSSDGISWTFNGCPAVGNGKDLPTSWVDNNPASPFYGRQYLLFNDYDVGNQWTRLTYSTDDGAFWSSPTLVSSSIRRAIKVTGSLGNDGTIFAQVLDEGGGGLNGPRSNFIYRSTDGGSSFPLVVQDGPTFLGPGRSVAAGGIYVGMYSTPVAGYWLEMGFGSPGVGPNNVVHYAYAARTTAPADPGNIYYVRSTDNGQNWSAPVQLNTDTTTRAQWSPSLAVNARGVISVSWYDERNTSDDSLQRFARASLDNGATWGSDMPLSDVIFPKPLQPDASIQDTYVGWFPRASFSDGGYGNDAYHTWTDGRVSISGSPQQDVFFDKVSFPPCTTFSQNFDGVTAPALPAGWVATNAQGPAPLWVTSTTAPDTAPNSAFVADPDVVSDKRLDTPGISITAASAQVSFRNNYRLESNGTNYYDGGVLEVSSPNINGGAFTDITNVAVGGSFVSGGYNATISGCCSNPIAGQMAWSGNSGDFINTVANLGPNVAGQTIKLRFRMGSDNSASDLGWQIDTAVITEVCTGAPVPSAAVSRKIHGGAGTFDINLPLVPLAGAVGIEDRTGGGAGGHQMVVTFANPVTVGGASVTAGTGSVGSFSVSGAVVTINLTGVANAQRLGVTLTNVSDGANLGSVMIPMGVLLGDTTGNRSVNSSDISQTKGQSGTVASSGNFRTDVTVNGSINSSDISSVKSKSGTALPP